MNLRDKQNRMYSNVPNLTIGFHGCDKTVADMIITGQTQLKISRNSYDWLGNGMYFWEQNLSRAWQWAEEHSETPAVIGAVIDLGYCLNLMDNRSSELLKQSYILLDKKQSTLRLPIPQNKNANGDTDLLLRFGDCAVIQNLHAIREEVGQRSFDSVRGLFLEGGEIYPNSGFREKTHIQIAVRNPNCIKGFFIPREIDSQWDIP